jgi:hypothetical protein
VKCRGGDGKMIGPVASINCSATSARMMFPW